MKIGSLKKAIVSVMLLPLFLLTCVQSPIQASATSTVIQNDAFFKDTAGNPIYSQGGMILKVGSTYYWYGVHYTEAESYASNPSHGKYSTDTFKGFSCYSSTDLINWTNCGDVMTSSDPNLAGCTWAGRMGVCYNTNTQKYVLISQFCGNKGNGVLFATSSSPTGPFSYNKVVTSISGMVNNMTGDQSLFIDTDGTPYLICSSTNGRAYQYVIPLNSADYLSFGTPHLVSSGTDADFCHVSQTGFFYTVSGSSGTTVIFCGDRWSDFAGNGLGYNVWCPLTFSGSTPSFQSISQWSLNAAAGSWSVGAGNNYVLNNSFEADRVVQTSVAGWSQWTNLSGATPFTNVSKGHTGNFAGEHTYASAYQASSYQTLNIPNGIYTLTAWVESSGGQSTCQLYAKNFGGAEVDKAVNTAMGSWTQETISGIQVTNGAIQIGVYSVANSGNWVKFDDFSLIKN